MFFFDFPRCILFSFFLHSSGWMHLWSPSQGLKRPRHFHSHCRLLSSCIHCLPCHVCAIYPAEAQVNKKPIQPHAAPNYPAKLMAGSISRRRADPIGRSVLDVSTPVWIQQAHTDDRCVDMCTGFLWFFFFSKSPADSVSTHVTEQDPETPMVWGTHTNPNLSNVLRRTRDEDQGSPFTL